MAFGVDAQRLGLVLWWLQPRLDTRFSLTVIHTLANKDEYINFLQTINNFIMFHNFIKFRDKVQ